MKNIFQNLRQHRAIALGACLIVLVLAGLAILAGKGGSPDTKRAQGPQPSPGAAKPVGPTLLVLPRARPSRPGGGSGRGGVGAGEPAKPDFIPGRLLVKFEDGTRPETADAALDRADADPEAKLRKIDVNVVEVAPGETAEAIASLKASPAVEYVERDVAVSAFETVPNDSLWTNQWGPSLVKAPEAWDREKGVPGVVVAVLDTGIDGAHPDLKGSLVAGYDFVNKDSVAGDDNGHGTAAAGVIAARTNNREGQAGICWNCSLMPVKVLGANGSGDTGAVAAGIVWAVDHGAKVISLSLGSSATTLTLTSAVEYAVSKGAVLVAAAGNSGTSALSYPAAHSGVISVAGTTQSNTLYSWSNYGSWVAVTAPGCNAAPGIGGGYVNFCGTSSATPIVAGIAALALSLKPAATRAEIELAIRSSAVPFSSAVQSGRVSAVGALAALVPASDGPAPAAPGTPPPPAGQPSPAAAPSAGPTTTVFRGRLSPRRPRRLYVKILPTGQVTATVSFTGSGLVTLAVLDNRGRRLGRVSSRRTLRLSEKLPAGAYRFVVEGRSASGPFALKITQP